MTLQHLGLLAGSVSTAIFVAAYVPMLVKAGRTHDLTSYSPANLIIANVGNGVYSVYVFTLPVGPIWILHSFYVGSTALMLFWWWRHHGRARRRGEHVASLTGLTDTALDSTRMPWENDSA